MRVAWGAGLLLGITLSGCATTLSSHQTAIPVSPGHVEVSLATGFYAPVGATLGAVDEGIAQAVEIAQAAASGEQYEVTPEAQQRLITAGLALAVMPPSPSQEISIRTGLLDNWDAGLRYSV